MPISSFIHFNTGVMLDFGGYKDKWDEAPPQGKYQERLGTSNEVLQPQEQEREIRENEKQN